MFDRTTKLHLRARYRKNSKGKKTLIGYYAEAYDPGRTPSRKYVALGTKDKTGAANRLAAMDAAVSRGEYDPWRDQLPEEGVTLREAIERYTTDREKRETSVRNDRSVLGALADTLPQTMQPGHVTSAHLTAYLDSRPIGASTRRTYVARLKAFFSWAAAKGFVRQNPASALEMPRLGRRTPRYLTREEYARLLAAIEEDVEARRRVDQGHVGHREGTLTWLSDVIRFAVGTGMRVAEICHLRWGAVDRVNRLVTVRNEAGFRTKSGHERGVPLVGEALAVVERRATTSRSEYVFVGVDGRRLCPTYVSKRFRHYADLVGLHDITFHATRRTYASWLAMSGVPISGIQQLIGHQSIETTSRAYAYLSPDSLRTGVERVFGDNPPTDR